MNDWREEFILGSREKWEPPPQPLKPVSPSIAICSLTQLGSKMTVKFSALRVFSELPAAPWGQPQSLFGSYPAFSPSYPTLAHPSPYHKVVFQ